MLLLNEVYFGKTKDIQAIEDQLGKFRSKYYGYFNASRTTCNNDPELLKFNRMIEDFFGFGCYSLHVTDVPIENAMTMPLSYRMDTIKSSRAIIADKRTFKFKKELDYAVIVYIYSGLIFNDQYTDAEVLAIILHEIGHNFQACLRPITGAISFLFGVYVGLSAIINIILGIINVDFMRIKSGIEVGPNSIYKYVEKFEKECRSKRNLISYVLDGIDLIKNMAMTYRLTVSDFIDKVTMGALKIGYAGMHFAAGLMFFPVTYLFTRFKYNNELTADNFATMYGYGSDLMSALGKMESRKYEYTAVDKVYNKIPLVSHIYVLNNTIVRMLVTPFDEHPVACDRSRDQLRMLEAELQKEDMDPKMKKVIKADIAAIDKAMRKYLLDIDKVTDIDTASKIYQNAMFKMNFREKIYADRAEERFADYDKVYKERRTK